MKKAVAIAFCLSCLIAATTIILTFSRKSSPENTPTESGKPISVVEQNNSALDNSLNIPKDAVLMYITPDGNIENARQTLEIICQLSDEICSGINNDYDKLSAISNWVSNYIYYDFDACESSVTIENIALSSVLSTRRTVCLGFSNLYAALCCAQGIDCRIAHGTAVASGTFADNDQEELHEWNVALIDKKAVWIDSLWNTTNAYRDGNYLEGTQSFEYFDISEEALALDHRAERVDVRNYFSALE